MGLRDLKTDLKSLRYSGDTLGGGTSNQPYIKAKIPDGFNNLQNAKSDFILRGGILAVRDSAADVLRLGKMFIDTKSPSGLLFIAKQQLLSRIAVRTQTSGRLLNEGVYSPLSTLAQAGVVAFGGHLNKQGINPFAGTGAYSNNDSLYGVRVKNTQPIDENRLVRLASNEEITLNRITLNDGVNVMTYSGGPGAPLGIGKTGIRYVGRDQRTGINNANGKKIVAGTYQTTRPSGRTSSNIISPINRGVSRKYLDYTKGNLSNNPLTSPDGEPAIILSGYGYTLRNSNNVYQSGSLKPDFQVTTSQKILKSVLLDPTDSSKDKQQGGLKINTDTPWNGNISPDSELLPRFNVNSSQNTSLDYVNNTQPQPQNTWVYKQSLTLAVSQSDVGSTRVGAPVIQDFRAILREKLQGQDKEKAEQSGATPIAPAYSGPESKNYEKRVNIGGRVNGGLGPGNKTGKNLISYTSGSNIGPIDKINALNLYSSTAASTNSTVNDLVKFRIAAINNKNPSLKTFMHFRAFIDNFSDSYNATWNPINYLGRGESFYTYNGFTRTISLGWTVAAQSKEELMPMYRKLNYLASNLTPDYTGKGYMTGNLVQLTIGGYLYEQVGFINSLTYDLPAESPWEIGINDEGNYDSTTKEMPHILKVTGFSFTPIHDFIPSKQTLTAPNGNITGFGLQKYIALSNTVNDTSDGYSYIDSTTNV